MSIFFTQNVQNKEIINKLENMSQLINLIGKKWHKKTRRMAGIKTNPIGKYWNQITRILEEVKVQINEQPLISKFSPSSGQTHVTLILFKKIKQTIGEFKPTGEYA